jgi:hypothetical protein
MENAVIFYGHLEYFTVIWYILWPFGTVVVIWYIFPRFGILCREKSGSPGFKWKAHFYFMFFQIRNCTYFFKDPVMVFLASGSPTISREHLSVHLLSNIHT